MSLLPTKGAADPEKQTFQIFGLHKTELVPSFGFIPVSLEILDAPDIRAGRQRPHLRHCQGLRDWLGLRGRLNRLKWPATK